MSIRSHLAPAALAALVACAPACAAKAPPPRLAVAALAPPPDRPPPPAPPAWTYWEPVDATVHGAAIAPTLPLAEADIVTLDGAAARWAALSPEARAAVVQRGFTAVPRATPIARFGEAYASLADLRVPYIVTLDALFWVAHVARDRALAAAESAVLAPALGTLLGRLEARLAADEYGAPSDLVTAFVLARGVVSVARSLLSPAYQPPVDLARVVAEENRRITAHEGPSVSPLLGVTVDYSQIVPRGEADASAARAAYARVVAWLDAAPFVVGARTEVEGGQLSISSARTHTRAALLIARLVDANVDVEAARAWHQWNALSDLEGGASDDVSLRTLTDTATAAGMSVRNDRTFVDVAKLDRIRHALLSGHAPRLHDGAAIAGARSRDTLRAATSVRILPARAATDAELLQSLVFPSVGRLAASDGGPPPETARDGVRALPSALDVGAWLAAEGPSAHGESSLAPNEARGLLRESGDDAYERYDATLSDLSARRPAEGLRHDSLYASSLDALATYLGPSAADVSQPGASSVAWHRRKLEGTLAGWATLRHDALAFARFPLPNDANPHPPPPSPLREEGEVVAFVEVHPEAIAKLLALVRQTTRGLRALGDVPEDSPARPTLDAADHILADALAIARREADDLPLTAEEHDALAAFPERLAALEASLVASRAADASLAIDVHTDLVSSRALVEACGDLDDLYVAFREPRTNRLVLALGATASHYEVTEHARDRTTDSVWRARLHGPSPPARAAYTRFFLAPAPSPEPLDASAPD